MTALAATTTTIPAMTAETIEQVRAFEALVRQEPQVVLETSHVLHAGIYARTIVVPAGIVLCATLIKIPTIVIVQGHAAFHTGDGETIEVEGYQVIPAAAGRKQVVYAHADTWITMAFPTNAKSVEDAENEFTDEADTLGSRRYDCNTTTITGVK